MFLTNSPASALSDDTNGQHFTKNDGLLFGSLAVQYLACGYCMCGYRVCTWQQSHVWCPLNNWRSPTAVIVLQLMLISCSHMAQRVCTLVLVLGSHFVACTLHATNWVVALQLLEGSCCEPTAAIGATTKVGAIYRCCEYALWIYTGKLYEFTVVGLEVSEWVLFATSDKWHTLL